MSESTTTNNPESAESHSAETPPVPEHLFDKSELNSFDAEDGQAGSVIGKMLSLFFLYTVIVMALVVYWTFSVTGE